MSVFSSEERLPKTNQRPDVAAGRLAERDYAHNFLDIRPPYSSHEAAVASDRCYFCHDAPCVAACPTGIDIPLFIRQISSGMPRAAAKTILDSNILGGMCARVCPTETLCEEVCVREDAEGVPVEIGRLQRFATDALMASDEHPYKRSEPTGKHVAVVGAGPAGLACAHRLAMKGHEVTLFDARAKPGGLNEYGVAAYKTVDGFAAREIDWLLEIGGIAVNLESPLSEVGGLSSLLDRFDAVFLGIGLAGVNALRIEGNDSLGVRDAVDFIEDVRQAEDYANIPIGRNVVVIGGGMTAIDAAVQSKHLGAESVSIVYRRSTNEMSASAHEQSLAKNAGVRILTNAQPKRILDGGQGLKVEFELTENSAGGLVATGETFRIAADQVFRAIGQRLDGSPDGPLLENGKIKVEGPGRTSIESVWAGGDCATGGDDLTVTAVAEGRNAAEDIHASLTRTAVRRSDGKAAHE